MNDKELQPALRMPVFAQFVARPPRSRRTIVLSARREAAAEYRPECDFYLQVRRELQRVCRAEAALSELQSVVSRVHPRKREHVQRVVDGFTSWAEQHDLHYFSAPSATWTSRDGLLVRVNPELGLTIDGQPTLVKTNLTSAPTSAAEAATMNALMLHTLTSQAPRGCMAAVLDARTGLFQSATRVSPLDMEALDAHATAVRRLWDEVEAETAN